jgi:acrylyl-CoA reductase (NADPH)
LAQDLDLARLEAMIRPATLHDLPRLAGEILGGQVQGRVVIDPAG